ncbi:MAG: MOSC domain-containing protein [Microthrixaceae bacterium]|nr:MOSC domain-containing protein [Microthrixaceae bacterium]
MTELDARVAQTWIYPVKSLQGTRVESLDVRLHGVKGDRNWALFDLDAGKVLSAKRLGRIFDGFFDDDSIVLPDGTRLPMTECVNGGVCDPISEWLGRPIRVCSVDDIAELGDGHLTYQMTFDPPNDDSEYYDIPMPEGSFVDLAPLHMLTTATLHGCRSARPDLNWDVRRFRPNILVDVDGEMFLESQWQGRPIRIGDDLVIEVAQGTVRCAMPLRRQPALDADNPELDRQPELYQAMVDLRPEMPNHLGVYVNVLEPGTVRVGDQLSFV